MLIKGAPLLRGCRALHRNLSPTPEFSELVKKEKIPKKK